jgi:hypothetical protein
MIHSRNPNVECGAALRATHHCAWRLQRLYLTKPRLISNLLALVALFSIGFM